MCGLAFGAAKTVVVPATSRFPGHIACDAETRSEIVVPVVVTVPGLGDKGEGEGEGEGGIKEKEQQAVVAVLDVDCMVENGFDAVDEEWLGRLAALLARCCDWDMAIAASETEVRA